MLFQKHKERERRWQGEMRNEAKDGGRYYYQEIRICLSKIEQTGILSEYNIKNIQNAWKFITFVFMFLHIE